jgi:Lectin C-type domain
LKPVRLGRATCSTIDVRGGQYAVCAAPLSHVEAEEDCELRDAHLVALESAEENEAVADAVFATSISGNVWLGGSRNEDFVWSWPNGAAFWRGGRDGAPEGDAFVPWQPGEPNDTSSQTGEPEACLALTGEGADWNDRSCELALPYVCELD